MKKNYLKWTLSSLLDYRKYWICYQVNLIVAVKTPNLVIENQTGNSEIKSAKMIEQKLSQDRVKQIVTAEFLVQTYQKLKISVEKEIHLKVN